MQIAVLSRKPEFTHPGRAPKEALWAGKNMMRYVSKEAFDVLLRFWSLEITNIDEMTQAPLVGVELDPPTWWEAFDHKRYKTEDLSAVIIRTGLSKIFQQIAASEAKQRTLH